MVCGGARITHTHTHSHTHNIWLYCGSTFFLFSHVSLTKTSPASPVFQRASPHLHRIYTFRVPTRYHLQKSKSPSSNLSHFRRLCSVTGDNNVSGSSDSYKKIHDHEGSRERNEKSRSPASNDVLKNLKRYGISGILSYGLLNTAYYLTTFLLVWFYVAPAPGKMGYFAAAERFLKVMAMVWAGSQVTKLVRAGGALALAPFVDRGLSWFTGKFKFESQEKAFIAIVGFCFGLALVLFIVMTLLWA